MNRWLSLEAFASCCAAAGLGLLVWLGISMALLHEQGGGMVLLRHVQFLGLTVACVLSAGGLAGMRWRGNGTAGIPLDRVGSAATVLALALGVLMAVLLSRKPFQPLAVAPLAAFLAFVALIALLVRGHCDSVSGRAGWRGQMVLPGLLCYALLAGACLLFALLAIKWPAQGMLPTLAPSLMVLAGLMAGLKLIYWFENGGLRAPVPGFGPADPARIRMVILALLALLPLVLALVLFAWPSLAPRLGWCLAIISVLAGGLLDLRLQQREAGRTPAATRVVPT